MSTRKLIIAALVCGVAILVAGTVLLLNVSTSDLQRKADQTTTSTTVRR